MALLVSAETRKHLSPMVVSSLTKLNDEQQGFFEAAFNQKKRSYVVHQLLAIFFPIQFFIRGDVLLGILFWVTGGGLWVWWIWEIFTQRSKVRDYNDKVATEVLRDLRVLS
ncbi:hypothetical protein [Shewanella algae]|uniref:hypothetical protein n=1 Tax=Shewanella algae TaxID=38313 RepID=UPI0031F50E5F